MAQIIIAILIIGIIFFILPRCKVWMKKVWLQLMQKINPHNDVRLFDKQFIEAKALYLKEFKSLPCIHYINNIDAAKVYELVNTNSFDKVQNIYQHNFYSWQQKRMEFCKTIFKLENRMLVSLGEDWAEILFSDKSFTAANKMMESFAALKAPEKQEDFEINVITLSNNCLDLKQLEIKLTVLDIDLYYNDDFKAIDAIIKERLTKQKDKGIILLHGLPGTGKTTYLRHLIGTVKKKVLFVSPAVAGNLMNPDFIDLLIDNPDSVLVIEDAENIIMDRKFSENNSVSNLLNLSDGLLSDCLNVQIICTFNSALSLVDSALLRKGRLIAKYEFGKLSVDKARKLSNHLAMKQNINRPMTLAEITNPDETDYTMPQVNVIGFRRELIEN